MKGNSQKHMKFTGNLQEQKLNKHTKSDYAYREMGHISSDLKKKIDHWILYHAQLVLLYCDSWLHQVNQLTELLHCYESENACHLLQEQGQNPHG